MPVHLCQVNKTLEKALPLLSLRPLYQRYSVPLDVFHQNTSNETEQRGGKNALVLLMYLRGRQKSLRSQSNYECIMFFVLSTRSIKYIFSQSS